MFSCGGVSRFGISSSFSLISFLPVSSFSLFSFCSLNFPLLICCLHNYPILFLFCGSSFPLVRHLRKEEHEGERSSIRRGHHESCMLCGCEAADGQECPFRTNPPLWVTTWGRMSGCAGRIHVRQPATRQGQVGLVVWCRFTSNPAARPGQVQCVWLFVGWDLRGSGPPGQREACREDRTAREAKASPAGTPVLLREGKECE